MIALTETSVVHEPNVLTLLCPQLGLVDVLLESAPEFRCAPSHPQDPPTLCITSFIGSPSDGVTVPFQSVPLVRLLVFVCHASLLSTRGPVAQSSFPSWLLSLFLCVFSSQGRGMGVGPPTLGRGTGQGRVWIWGEGEGEREGEHGRLAPNLSLNVG